MERVYKIPTMGNVELIGSEEIEVLRDICYRCYFENSKQKDAFWNAVFTEVGVSSLELIPVDSFETAFGKAMSLLREQGDSIFAPKAKHIPHISHRKEFKVKRRF